MAKELEENNFIYDARAELIKALEVANKENDKLNLLVEQLTFQQQHQEIIDKSQKKESDKPRQKENKERMSITNQSVQNYFAKIKNSQKTKEE